MKKVIIKQVRSGIGRNIKQKRTLEALGLRKINHEREIELSPQVKGMINKVLHLIEVKEL
ncbi:MAG: 50S ribosomal protein L30 [Bacteroidales bacterium]|nr:50S ribosomal protein L30 [Bacteroidales bacterium]